MPTIPNFVNGKVKKVLTGKTGPLDTYFKNLRRSEDAAALSRISFEKSTRADEARKEREEDAKRRKLEKRREERNATRRKAYAEKSAYENENEGDKDDDNSSTAAIEFVIDDDGIGHGMKKRSWNERPKYWESMVDHYNEAGGWKGNGLEALRSLYKEEFSNYDDKQMYKLLNRWTIEKRKNKKIGKPGTGPVYGNDIDQKLYDLI